MSRKHRIIAAGGVILRERSQGLQVLLIHRDRYDDWSLPKGKGEADELLPETALREIDEETGVEAVLDLRLPSVRYETPKGPKVSHYWRARVRRQRNRRPDQEVQAVTWFPVEEAIAKATYPAEQELITQAVRSADTHALLIVRHAKAMQRKHWSGDDQRRRLSGRGRRQAKRLVDLLAAFGIEQLISSSSERCVQTLQPYAKARGLTIRTVDALTEEAGSRNPKAVRKYMAKLLAGLDRPTAVCGHRPVLPEMYAGLGLDAAPMVVAEVRGLHVADGKVLATETFKPTA
ncbi:MAG: NUDIX hydrolase [Arachnia propionica]|uniref:NUDIX hydrolase n=1 Tax=Arachnia propionica TaxID=1750 RepID=UPI00270433AC|nr:NUDIX hydrolase [Arachnia propionica]